MFEHADDRLDGEAKDPAKDLASLVSVLVRPLIENEDELDIAAFDLDRDTIMVEIRVDDDDAGKVIGRQGRIIKAIRTLVRAAASRSGKFAEVELID